MGKGGVGQTTPVQQGGATPSGGKGGAGKGATGPQGQINQGNAQINSQMPMPPQAFAPPQQGGLASLQNQGPYNYQPFNPNQGYSNPAGMLPNYFTQIPNMMPHSPFVNPSGYTSGYQGGPAPNLPGFGASTAPGVIDPTTNKPIPSRTSPTTSPTTATPAPNQTGVPSTPGQNPIFAGKGGGV